MARAHKLAVVLACAAGGLFALSLSCRQLDCPDMGYHLAYGEAFWREGRVVDDARFIYPPPTAATAKPDDLPPGAYYDADGQYRFVNANWLAQVVMAGLHNLGGWTALWLLQVGLTGIVLAAQALAVRRMGGSWAWLGPMWLLTGMVSYERLSLRPEMFSFACLAVILWLLCGAVTWPRVAAAIGVQFLAANFHSYWLLGAGLMFAFAGEAALRGGWSRWIVHVPRAGPRPAPTADPSGRRGGAGGAGGGDPSSQLAKRRRTGADAGIPSANHIAAVTPDEVDQMLSQGSADPWR